MTLLPIVDRELRVAARSPGTFWLRVGAALAGMLIQTGVLLVCGFLPLAGASTPGGVLFGVVTWICLVGALSAGLFFTSDCLSAEQREGTLGFLFLTDLRGYDVVGGKLLSTSLRCVYGLIAVCPVLAVALLFGSVSGMQLLKTILALLNAMFYSLAAGMWISSISRESQKALGATLLLLLALVLGGPVADAILSQTKHHSFPLILGLVSPGYVFISAGAWGRNLFWLALGLNQLTAWAMLGLAALAAPRMWQQRTGLSRVSPWSSWWKFGGPRRRAALRGRLLERNPVLWLVSRERWQADALWGMAILFIGAYMGLRVAGAPQGFWTVWIPIWYLSVPMLYLWMAAHASRFFLEAHRTGLIELLLTTPVDETQIVRAQWLAILRSFGLPIVLLLVVLIASLCRGQFPSTALVLAQAGGTSPAWLLTFGIIAADSVTVVAGLAALVWFAMWMGLTSKSTGAATLKTMLFVKVIPCFAVFFVSSFLSFAVLFPRLITANRTGARPASLPLATGMAWPLLMAWVPAAVNVAIDLGLIALARQQLRTTLRQRAAGALIPVSLQPQGPLPPVFPSASPTRAFS
jgi:ABC-2 family transporter protein